LGFHDGGSKDASKAATAVTQGDGKTLIAWKRLCAWAIRTQGSDRVHDIWDDDRGRISSLFAWRSGAREEFEVKDDGKAVAAFGGGPKDHPW